MFNLYIDLFMNFKVKNNIIDYFINRFNRFNLFLLINFYIKVNNIDSSNKHMTFNTTNSICQHAL